MGVTYLLDTHVLVWLLDGEPRPNVTVLQRIEQPHATLLVSAVSAFELATKFRLGKFDAARDLVENWSHRIATLGARELPITAEHSLHAGSLGWDHRDPFDRLLVAQAIIENLTLVTADRAVLGAPKVTLLPW